MSALESLPIDVLIERILSRINDAKDLASLASCSRWCRQWTALAPQVVFNFPRSWRQDKRFRCKDAEQIIVSRPDRQPRRLEVHFSPTEFRLQCLREAPLRHCVDSSSRNLEELRISNRGCAYSDLLATLSSCPKLRLLELDAGYFDKVPTFPPTVKSLAFSNIIFTADDLVQIVHKSPALEELRLDRCFSTQRDSLIVAASALRRLSLLDCTLCELTIHAPRLEFLELKSCSVNLSDETRRSLLELSIMSSASSPRAEQDQGAVVLERLELLSINGKGWTSQEFLGLLNSAPKLRELRLLSAFSTKDVIPSEDLVPLVKKLQKLVISSRLFPPLEEQRQ